MPIKKADVMAIHSTLVECLNAKDIHLLEWDLIVQQQSSGNENGIPRVY